MFCRVHIDLGVCLLCDGISVPLRYALFCAGFSRCVVRSAGGVSLKGGIHLVYQNLISTTLIILCRANEPLNLRSWLRCR